MSGRPFNKNEKIRALKRKKKALVKNHLFSRTQIAPSSARKAIIQKSNDEELRIENASPSSTEGDQGSESEDQSKILYNKEEESPPTPTIQQSSSEVACGKKTTKPRKKKANPESQETDESNFASMAVENGVEIFSTCQEIDKLPMKTLLLRSNKFPAQFTESVVNNLKARLLSELDRENKIILMSIIKRFGNA